MRRTAYMVALLLSACSLQAVDPSLLMRTRTDPTRMRLAQHRPRAHMCVAWLKGGETAFTHVAWVRRREALYQSAFSAYSWMNFFSVLPARATREGGDELPAIREVSTAFSGSGGTFANPNYDTHGIAGWEYGCYAVNIETDTPLTLVLAGTEKQVAGSSGVMQAFNIQGSAADWSWSIAGGNGIRFGFGVNPLVEFFGTMSINGSVNETMGAATPPGGVIGVGVTNEWTMLVSRARIEGGQLMTSVAELNWAEEHFAEGEQTNAAPAAAFARNARTEFIAFGTAGIVTEDGTPILWDEYGVKVWGKWLSDDEVRTVRDLDMFEMRRRGMTQWASEENVQ